MRLSPMSTALFAVSIPGRPRQADEAAPDYDNARLAGGCHHVVVPGMRREGSRAIVPRMAPSKT